jgi:hypothetical protein
MAISPTQGSTLGSILESQGPAPKVTQASAAPETIEFKEILAETGSYRAETQAASAPVAAASITEQSVEADPKTEPAVMLQAPKTDYPIATTEPALEQKSLAVVRDALMSAGIPLQQVTLSYREEMVWYPGGNWINHYITATTSDGRSMDFSAKLAERSPHVTAAEIDSYLLNGGGGIVS